MDLSSEKLTFSGKTDSAEYQLELCFFNEIDKEASKVSVSPRSIFCVIVKKEEGHWDRLTKESQQKHIKCDWNKWVVSESLYSDLADHRRTRHGSHVPSHACWVQLFIPCCTQVG